MLRTSLRPRFGARALRQPLAGRRNQQLVPPLAPALDLGTLGRERSRAFSLLGEKVPKTITHQNKLHDTEPLLDAFLAEATALGSKLAVLLVQLPPELAYDAETADHFFKILQARAPRPSPANPGTRAGSNVTPMIT